MILLEPHPSPAKLWLASSPPRSGEQPAGRGDHPELAKSSLRVLIVEDEFFISLHTSALLRALGHSVVAVAVSADEAVAVAERERPDVVLMDIRLVGARDGIDAANEIRTRFDIGSIFVTANADPGTRQRAVAVQPVGFLEKPLTEERLRAGLATVTPK
jgi:two-component system, response regulator PdtaR